MWHKASGGGKRRALFARAMPLFICIEEGAKGGRGEKGRRALFYGMQLASPAVTTRFLSP